MLLRQSIGSRSSILSAAGVSVISGLALGIDGAAHEGACAAGTPPVAVVAGGLDDPYPRRHARLWARVAEHGAIVSESPAGVGTEKWRFPTRNRLLAALSDVVVVVESRPGGGSRHTVDAALARGVAVGAVPGSIRSPTSEGTNALLAEGAFPVCAASRRPRRAVALRRTGHHPRAPESIEGGFASERDARAAYPRRTDRRAHARRPSGRAERSGPLGGVRRAGAALAGRAGSRRRWMVGADLIHSASPSGAGQPAEGWERRGNRNGEVVGKLVSR